MMFLVYAVTMMLLAVSEGHANKREVTQIGKMYSDMDTDSNNMVTATEIFNFFSAMSNSPAGDGLSFYDFDYNWGINYLDGRAVTTYIFDTWDVNNNGILDSADLVTLFAQLDTDGSSWISFNEFGPYMEKLYANGPLD